MGMPGELWSRKQLIEYFGSIDKFLPGPDGHFVVDGYLAGQVTDDTQQSEVLAQVLVDGDGEVHPELFGQRLVEWADRVGASEGKFLGPTSSKAIQGLREGLPMAQVGNTGDTNGAAMRVVPLGLSIPLTDIDWFLEQVANSCRPTHFTDVAISGAALIAAAASAAIDAVSFGDVVGPALDAAGKARNYGNRVMGASVVRRAQLAIDIALRYGDSTKTLEELYDVVGSGVSMTEAAPVALGIAVAANGNPARSARLSANLGGDTDTIGAMATGICGAFSGLKAIPAGDLSVLQEVNKIDYSSLAAAIFEIRLKKRKTAQ